MSETTSSRRRRRWRDPDPVPVAAAIDFAVIEGLRAERDELRSERDDALAARTAAEAELERRLVELDGLQQRYDRELTSRDRIIGALRCEVSTARTRALNFEELAEEREDLLAEIAGEAEAITANAETLIANTQLMREVGDRMADKLNTSYWHRAWAGAKANVRSTDPETGRAVPMPGVKVPKVRRAAGETAKVKR